MINNCYCKEMEFSFYAYVATTTFMLPYQKHSHQGSRSLNIQNRAAFPASHLWQIFLQLQTPLFLYENSSLDTLQCFCAELATLL